MEVARRVTINTGILYARMAITVFISLYSTRLILNALGAGDFGLFNLVGGTIAMLGFLNTSMASATQRFMSYAQGHGDFDQLKEIFNVSLLLHLLIAIALFFILEVAGYYLFDGVLTIAPERLHASKLVYQFAIISALFTVISVPYDAVINARENMLLFAILGIVEAVLKLAIAVYITFSSTDKLISYGVLMTVLAVFLLLVRAVYCQKQYEECEIRLGGHYDKKLTKEMASFAGWSFLGSSSSIIANYGQGIVMNMFFTTAVNAAQGIASQVSGQLSVFASTMLKALNPIITKSEGAGNRDLMLKASLAGSKIAFFLLMLMFIPMLIEAPYILKLWLNEVPTFAVIFCQLQLIRNLIDQLFVTLVASISAVGTIRQFELVAAFLTFFPLPVSYLLFTNGFAPSSLYLVFIGYAIVSSANILYFANKVSGLSISVFFRDILFPCGISFLITLTLSYLPCLIMEEGVFRLFTVLGINVVIFSLVVWIIGLNKDDRGRMQEVSKGLVNTLGQKSNLLLDRIRLK